MFTLVDDASDPDVPADVLKAVKKLPSSIRPFSDDDDGVSIESTSGSRGGGGDNLLNRFDIETHKFSAGGDVSLGWLGKMVGLKASALRGGVTQEAKWYRTERTDKGHTAQYGTSVRLSVAMTKLSISADLSMANLAAAAQLGKADTRIGLKVIGYAGPLGDIMPAPSDLDVENFAVFMEAFDKLQKRIFGDEGTAHLSPTLLGYEDHKGE